MNTILTVVLLAAILTLTWVVRSVSEKFLKIFGNTDSTANQNEWRGNRVRAAGVGSNRS